MENNKGNQDTSASRNEEKTVKPNNNSERDFVNQTGKSQNVGNDSDYLTDPNNKANPETLAEGSEFLNDSIEQNVAFGEKDADTQEFYNQGNEGSQNNMSGKVKSTMIDEHDNEDSADLDESQVRRNT